MFSIEDRKRLLGKVTKDLGDIEIVAIEGLLADFVKENDIDFMVIA